MDQTSGILSNMGGLHDNTSFLSPLQDIFSTRSRIYGYDKKNNKMPDGHPLKDFSDGQLNDKKNWVKLYKVIMIIGVLFVLIFDALMITAFLLGN